MTLALLAGARRRRLRASQRCTSTKTRVRWATGGSGRSAFQGWEDSGWLGGETFARIAVAHSTVCKRQSAADDGETPPAKSVDERAKPIHLLPNVSLPFI